MHGWKGHGLELYKPRPKGKGAVWPCMLWGKELLGEWGFRMQAHGHPSYPGELDRAANGVEVGH